MILAFMVIKEILHDFPVVVPFNYHLPTCSC